MNLDGCRNCEFVIFTGALKIMRCGKDQHIVDPLDTCGNYELKNSAVFISKTNGGGK